MNASIGFSKRDLHIENVRDTARRVREANRRTVGAVAQIASDIGETVAHRIFRHER